MAKCINDCKNEGVYKHVNGGYVCRECLGDFFNCPDCGLLFPLDTGDAGNGFCEDCAPNH